MVTKIPAKSAVTLPFPAEASIRQAPKEEVGVGVLVFSRTSTELYVVPPITAKNLPFLTTLLLEAFRHPQYCLILENDVDSQLTRIRLKNDDGSLSEMAVLLTRSCFLMNSPSLFPPISHDLTAFSQKGKSSCYEPEEELLNTISDLVDDQGNCNH